MRCWNIYIHSKVDPSASVRIRMKRRLDVPGYSEWKRAESILNSLPVSSRTPSPACCPRRVYEVQARARAAAGWELCTVNLTVTGTGNIRIHLHYSGGASTVYWDDVALREHLHEALPKSGPAHEWVHRKCGNQVLICSDCGGGCVAEEGAVQQGLRRCGGIGLWRRSLRAS